MSPERDIRDLFEQALDQPPEARGAFLTQACDGDPDLRRKLEALLLAADRARTAEVLPPLTGVKPAASSLAGQRVHNYEILAPIGEGGMGVVYHARHLFFPREAAIKVLHEHLVKDTVTVQRFLNEARAADAIKHPNIIEVYDAGLVPNSRAPYLVLEYLRGESLRMRLDRMTRLGLRETRDIADQTMSALAAAHARGIIHRDLKPENLYLVASEDGVRVKVLDFGIAKLHADLVTREVHTVTGAVIGTPRYMSPEQCRGHGAIDHRSDIYSLGVILYEMLCGRPPFLSEGLGEVIFMHIAQSPPPPRQFNPDLPASVEAALLKALAKEPHDRFASMGEFQEALAVGAADDRSAPSVAAQASPAAKSEQSTLEGAAKAVPTPRPPARRSVLVGLTLAAVAGAAVWFARSEPPRSAAVPRPSATATHGDGRGPPGPDAAARAAVGLGAPPAAGDAGAPPRRADAAALDAVRSATTKKRPRPPKEPTFEPAPW